MARWMVAVLVIAGCTDTAVAPVGNQAPVIGLAAASPAEHAAPGQAIAFTVGASDPDNDGVTYAWTASAGSVSGDGTSHVSWAVPATAGTYILRVIASDYQGAAAAAYWTVTTTAQSATISPPRIVRPVQLPSPAPSASASPSAEPTPGASPTPSTSPS